MVTKGEGGYKLGVWDEQIHITIQKINNKVLLYSVGNYIQYLAITYTGKESEKYIYIYTSESLCHTHETNTIL